MALDQSQFFKDPTTGVTYTSKASYDQNVNGVALPTSADSTTGQTGPVVIPAGQATGGTALNLAQPNNSTTLADSTAAGATSTANNLQSYIDQLSTPTTALDQQQNDLITSLQGLYGQDTGKSDYTLQQEQQAGIPGLKEQLAQLNGDILTKNAQYEKTYQDAESPDKTGGVTTFAVTGYQAAVRRAQASDLALQYAKGQALTGNLQAAEDNVSRAVDLKYQGIEEEITAKEKQLQVIQPLLSAEQQKVAQAQQNMLDDQKQKIADQKEEAKTNLNLALQAGVKTNFVNQNGKFFDARTGEVFPTPEAFFKAAGVTSFADAYSKGLITDVNGSTLADQDFASQARASYPTAGINLTDDQATIKAKIEATPQYRKENYIAPVAGSGGGGSYVPGSNSQVDAYVAAVRNGSATLTNVPAAIRGLVAEGLSQGPVIVDAATDAAVQGIIANNPGEYGKAVDAIDAQFGKGTASKYDSQLKAVYNDKQSVGNVFSSNTYTPTAASKYATTANKIVSNFVKLPAYVAVSQGQVYLPRIAAAAQNPGTIGDAELLDSIVKLNTGGNAITNEQVNLITGYGSYADKLNVIKNKLSVGGALSTQQRTDLINIAKETMANYQSAYAPIYQQATSQLQQAGIPQAFWTIPDLNSLTNVSQGQDSYDSYLKTIGQ